MCKSVFRCFRYNWQTDLDEHIHSQINQSIATDCRMFQHLCQLHAKELSQCSNEPLQYLYRYNWIIWPDHALSGGDDPCCQGDGASEPQDPSLDWWSHHFKVSRAGLLDGLAAVWVRGPLELLFLPTEPTLLSRLLHSTLSQPSTSWMHLRALLL